MKRLFFKFRLGLLYYKEIKMKYGCIEKLAKFLDESEVPYTRNPIWDGGTNSNRGALRRRVP